LAFVEIADPSYFLRGAAGCARANQGRRGVVERGRVDCFCGTGTREDKGGSSIRIGQRHGTLARGLFFSLGSFQKAFGLRVVGGRPIGPCSPPVSFRRIEKALWVGPGVSVGRIAYRCSSILWSATGNTSSEGQQDKQKKKNV